MEILTQLLSMQDAGYKEFHKKLIPNVPEDKIIGIRTPLLRRFAWSLDADTAKSFMAKLPHAYYEENNLHGFLIERIRDFDACIEALERFLPYVDNWATCDMLRPKCLAKEPERLLEKSLQWMGSQHTYTVRFGIGMLLSHFLDDRFASEQLECVARVNSQEYYIKMMIAWYFATALAKQYEAALPYLLEKRLPVWMHNKTIQKAIESFRISDDQKRFLKTLRIKEKVYEI